MPVVVVAETDVQKVFNTKPSFGEEVIFVSEVSELPKETDVVFFLLPESQLEGAFNVFPADATVFVNAVYTTSSILGNRCIRLNAWPGFLERDTIEVYAPEHLKDRTHSILHQLGWNVHDVPDVPGMISARIIAAVINEAFFALEEGVSTKKEIDLAMKLGTNYPFGPFEWAEKIGLINIYQLLIRLSQTDVSYQPARALTAEIT